MYMHIVPIHIYLFALIYTLVCVYIVLYIYWYVLMFAFYSILLLLATRRFTLKSKEAMHYDQIQVQHLLDIITLSIGILSEVQV